MGLGTGHLLRGEGGLQKGRWGGSFTPTKRVTEKGETMLKGGAQKDLR